MQMFRRFAPLLVLLAIALATYFVLRGQGSADTSGGPNRVVPVQEASS